MSRLICASETNANTIETKDDSFWLGWSIYVFPGLKDPRFSLLIL